MTEAEYKPRLTRPEAGNKYYIRKADGGYSSAIKGSPTDKDCNVLSNCVGYAYGRFNEVGGWGKCKYLSPVNAELFMRYRGDCEAGDTPQVGACMVWQKGATLSGSDGPGHVAIVEKVVSPEEVVTSESFWDGAAFVTKTRKKGNGRWGQGSSYTFLGFIYNPAVTKEEVDMTVEEVKKLVADEVSKAVAEIEKNTDKAIAAALPVYGNIEAVPDWYRPSIEKLVDKGVVRGTDDSGEAINKSEIYCQAVTTMDRLGLLD